ncbi:MAG: type III-B CRISPR module RAMP protein Cmr1 [Planctomycetaceae bacterium]|nr:type III-B CRISPR module RAMP protein Cmr1 [Planctomycetaceae bacterium]
MPKREDIPVCPKEFNPPRLVTRSEVYELELATPLFGGGVQARQNDEAHPIRESSIRGQLRFWWRATRGRSCPSLEALWQREEEVFGSTEFPSPLRVDVDRAGEKPPQFAPAGDFRQGTPEGYALFALQQGDRVIREGLKFRVKLSWLPVEQLRLQRAAQNASLVKAKRPQLPTEIADITDDLRDAVWAWVNFGGIGGRTRRGCGSLRCARLAPGTAADIPDWFRAATARFGSPTVSPVLWPVLHDQLVYHPTEATSVDAWLRAMRLFRDFRQGEDVGRNRRGAGSNRPGRSRFPEPETIREALKRRSPKHPRLPQIPNDAFPRAEFGLPIVFQFQGGEVDPTVLYPRVGGEQPERMASPLILKSLCLANGKAVPVIVRLAIPPFTAVELTCNGRRNVVGVPRPPTAVRRPNLATYPNSPLAGSTAGSAIEAFLAFTQNTTNGFTRC